MESAKADERNRTRNSDQGDIVPNGVRHIGSQRCGKGFENLLIV